MKKLVILAMILMALVSCSVEEIITVCVDEQITVDTVSVEPLVIREYYRYVVSDCTDDA